MRRHELLALFDQAVDEWRNLTDHRTAHNTIMDAACVARTGLTEQQIWADLYSARAAYEAAKRLADGTDKPQEFWDEPFPPPDGWDAERDRQIASHMADWDLFTSGWWTR